MSNDCENIVKNITDEIDELDKTRYFLTEKVFDNYKDKECLANIIVNCVKDDIKNINFKPCKMIVNSLNNSNKNKKVKIILKIPYEINTKQGRTIAGYLPDITRDISLKSNGKHEGALKIVVKTSTKIMFNQDLYNNKSKFTFLVKFMISSIGQVKIILPNISTKTPLNNINKTSNDSINKAKNKSMIESEDINSTNRIIYGRIIDKTTLKGVKEAVVGLFYGENISNLQMCCHTYSDYNGYYILNIPIEFQHSIVTIMASKTMC